MVAPASHPVTVYDYLAADLPLRNESMLISSRISMGDEVLLALGDDDGNGKKKLAILNRQSAVVTVEIPASYVEAADIRMGRALTAYRVNGGPTFWIGEDAVRNGGDALPIGPTAQRLADRRHRDFGAACVVEVLRKAGYGPDTYRLAVARAVPNEEVTAKQRPQADGTQAETVVVQKETRQALKQWLHGQTFQVERIDEDGQSATWTIIYAEVVPLAQSIGTFIAFSRDLYARNQLMDVEALRINDIGGGDDQLIEVIYDRGNWRMTARRLGDGTIDLARALARQFPSLQLNDAQAQFALEQRALRNETGRRQHIDAEIARVMQAEGQDMVARKLPLLQQAGYFLVFTGGGIRLPELRTAIAERAATAGKKDGEHYAFIDPEVSGVMNAFGVLMLLIFMASGRSL